MNKEFLFSIEEQLIKNMATLEKEDGHLIDSISIGQDYDQEGNYVYGISIRYSSDALSGTFALIKLVEEIAQQECLWFRFSPKGFFIYFQ